jgi:RNA polymerase sigma factor (sigma-70 family)
MQHQPIPLTDTQLIARCLEQDEAAWAELVTRYERLVYTVPLRYGLPADLAGDVFQQVFATLLEKLAEIQQPERIAAWLVTTARRESWRIVRRGAALSLDRLSGMGHEGGEVELADDDPLPEEQFERLERHAQLRAALRQLDSRCQRLLALLYFDESRPSYLEIASALEMKEGSIGPTRARCLKKLQEQLGEH